MFLRQCFRNKDGKRHAYWALVESYRTDAGPRQRVVAWLGKLDEAGRLGVEQAARDASSSHAKESTAASDEQLSLFHKRDDQEPVQPQWIEVNASDVRVENCRQFGGPWLALEIVRKLQLDEFLKGVMLRGREQVSWWRSALILVVARLCRPSSELYVAEQWYPKSALPGLLGVSADRVDDNRLYRTLDQLLPHQAKLEAHLKNRLGELFDLEYDLLMYDITSTYFEGQANFEMAQRGYSRDGRGDCKQVCIGLVVSRCGMPLGYEVFAGNTADVTTVEQIVTTMERRYGKSDRIWVMDRGMVSEDNIDFLRKEGRRYIVGTPKSMLKEFEAELLKDDWNTIREGLEVKLCCRPRDDDEVASADQDADGSDPAEEDQETFILCRSRDRSQKEEAIVRRFEQKIEQRLASMTARCERQNRDPMKVEREIGRLLGKNTRAAKLFEVTVEKTKDDYARIVWKKVEAARDWATLSAGCYLLRSNVTNWSDEELWKAYLQLTEAEAAFRIHKSDLKIRPIWHQKEERVLAHIFVCFLAYVLWKTLGQMCEQAGLGSEPRRVLDELSELRMMDVILPTRSGIEIRRRCLSKPTDHQQILLDRLQLRLPKINQTEM
ncbi:MAG: IS1634 family transposase [Pirellulaceae bacterium]|jgi:transposase|nr:IS1634 family transposase [Pirellulaceae bacterium]